MYSKNVHMFKVLNIFVDQKYVNMFLYFNDMNKVVLSYNKIVINK